MSSPELLLILARDLIGVRGIYQGREYALIEVLDSGPSLVLEPVHVDMTVQNTCQGEARRLVQSHYTVPFFSEVRQDLHPVVCEFLGQALSAVLREQIQADSEANPD